MSTQRANVLSQKMIRYSEYVFSNTAQSEINTLIFSLYTPIKRLSTSTIKSRCNDLELVSKANINYIRIAITSALLSCDYSNQEELETLENCKLEKIYSILKEVKERISPVPLLKDYQRFYENACEYMSAYIDTYHDTTLRDLIEGTREEINNSSVRIREDENSRLYNAYIERRQSITTAALSESTVDIQLKKGNSICTAPSRNLAYVLPNILIGLGGIDTKIYNLMSYCGYLSNSDGSYTYEPYSLTYQKDGYVLRNHFNFDNTHVYVENISDDIGGYVRVREYMQTLSFSGDTGILVCLVSSDDKAKELSKALWRDSLYAKTLHTSISNNELPLEVIYITNQ